MKIGHTGTDLFNFSSEIKLKASRDAKIIKSCMDSYTKNLFFLIKFFNYANFF